MEHEAYRRENEAEQKGPPEAPNLEAGDDGARQKDEEGVQYKDEKSESEDGEGESQKYEDRPDNGIDETEDKGGDDGGAPHSRHQRWRLGQQDARSR